MFGLQSLGKLLLVVGLVLAIMGGILILTAKVPWLGRLPGDIYIQRKSFTFYFPIVTCIIISLILTLIFALIKR